MYPFLRMAKELWVNRNAPDLPVLGTHLSHHMCWPWDLDPWVELNNGRTLTIFDLGRIPLGRRTGLDKALAQQKWGMTVAGSAIRYRRRIQMFHRLDMVSRCIGWDKRFLYIEQSLWKDGECTTHVVLRNAVFSKAGIIDPALLIEVMGHSPESPALPDWVQAWSAAEAQRPWPPARP